VLQVLGVGNPPAITIVPMLVGTATATAMAFAFAIFGKKRRDEQPPAPDEVLQASAARGHGDVPRGEAASGVVRSPAFPMPLDSEAGMPRWRRPSLLEARKADPARYIATTPKMSFETAGVASDASHERRVIRYRVARLLDAPDELRSADLRPGRTPRFPPIRNLDDQARFFERWNFLEKPKRILRRPCQRMINLRRFNKFFGQRRLLRSALNRRKKGYQRVFVLRTGIFL